MERQRETLVKITANIEEMKLKTLEAKFAGDDDKETITNPSRKAIPKHLNEMKANEATKGKVANYRSNYNLGNNNTTTTAI